MIATRRSRGKADGPGSRTPDRLIRRLLIPLVLCAAPLEAQTTVSLTPFAAVDRSLPGDPLLKGLSGAVFFGAVGVRGSGSLALRGVQLGAVSDAFDEDGVFAYAADLDLVLQSGRKAGAAGSFGGADSRFFAGVGVRGDRFAGEGTGTHGVLSFGSTLSYSLLTRVRAEIELRRVIPLDRATELLDGNGAASVGAWEYRAGLSLNFGAGPLRPRPGITETLPIPGTGRAPAPGGSPAADATPAPAGGEREVVAVAAGTVLETADTYVGIPYEWGGADPRTGFDCSGFVQYVFARHGVRLPRPSRAMARVGEPVHQIGQLRAGDLMFFDGSRNGQVDHVAIYAGQNMIIHASRSGRDVGYDDLSTSRGQWFRTHFTWGRRVLGTEIEGVTVHGLMPGVAAAPGTVRPRRGAPAPGIAAFLEAAGIRIDDLPEFGDLVRDLYRADEVVDPPDNAPARRW